MRVITSIRGSYFDATSVPVEGIPNVLMLGMSWRNSTNEKTCTVLSLLAPFSTAAEQFFEVYWRITWSRSPPALALSLRPREARRQELATGLRELVVKLATIE